MKRLFTRGKLNRMLAWIGRKEGMEKKKTGDTPHALFEMLRWSVLLKRDEVGSFSGVSLSVCVGSTVDYTVRTRRTKKNA